MENESTEGRTLSLEIPAALDEWLTERASTLDVDRSELIRQVIGGYQVAAETMDEESVAAVESAIGTGTVEHEVEATIQETVDEAVASATPDEDEIVDRVEDQVEDRMEARYDEMEADIEEKLDDIRRRVVQVKQATEAKAAADHTHPELERVEQVATEIESLREDVATLERTISQSDIAAEVEDVERKLTQLARVVVTLRETVKEGERDEQLAAIRRKAAREGYEEAVCGACGETVRIGLLPEPACPHCEGPFTDIVATSGGLFGSTPRLVVPHDRESTRPARTDDTDTTDTEAPSANATGNGESQGDGSQGETGSQGQTTENGGERPLSDGGKDD